MQAVKSRYIYFNILECIQVCYIFLRTVSLDLSITPHSDSHKSAVCRQDGLKVTDGNWNVSGHTHCDCSTLWHILAHTISNIVGQNRCKSLIISLILTLKIWWWKSMIKLAVLPLQVIIPHCSKRTKYVIPCCTI